MVLFGLLLTPKRERIVSSHWLINESSFDWSKLNLLHLHRAPRTWQDRTREFDKQEKNPYRTKRKTDKLVPDWNRYYSLSLRHSYDFDWSWWIFFNLENWHFDKLNLIRVEGCTIFWIKPFWIWSKVTVRGVTFIVRSKVSLSRSILVSWDLMTIILWY